ncbi:MAG: cell division/cell wall cluster transcriptional repressor MraZ, partial [Candidatus Falkowbacteria bacterium]|nr:cell division/cell wall cluster transcriptional repressor MraZ [Candidatus Falkowbacteria bacterium]
PRKKWEEIAEKLANLPLNQTSARAFARIILSGATDVEFDKQGRINLPDYLIKFANFQKKTVITGLYDRVEIWTEEAWNNYKASTDMSSEKIAEGLAELGL